MPQWPQMPLDSTISTILNIIIMEEEANLLHGFVFDFNCAQVGVNL